MRATLNSLGTGAILALVLTVLGGSSLADDAKNEPGSEEMMAAMAEAAKPGPEHAKLNSLVGNWTYACKIWMDPSKPPMESKGTIERKWVLGGRFLKEKYEGTGFDGKPGFEGMGLIGYDNGRKKYTSIWACSMDTGICTGLGVADASAKKFTFHTKSYCPMEKKVVKGREEVRLESDNKFVMESYVLDDEGKETKIMEIVAVRKNGDTE